MACINMIFLLSMLNKIPNCIFVSEKIQEILSNPLAKYNLLKIELQILKLIYLEEDTKYCKALFFVYGIVKIIKLIVMVHNVQLWK